MDRRFYTWRPSRYLGGAAEAAAPRRDQPRGGGGSSDWYRGVRSAIGGIRCETRLRAARLPATCASLRTQRIRGHQRQRPGASGSTTTTGEARRSTSAAIDGAGLRRRQLVGSGTCVPAARSKRGAGWLLEPEVAGNPRPEEMGAIYYRSRRAARSRRALLRPFPEGPGQRSAGPGRRCRSRARRERAPSATAAARKREWPLERTSYVPLYLERGGQVAGAQTASRRSSGRVRLTRASPWRARRCFDHRFEEDTELTGYMKLKLWVEAARKRTTWTCSSRSRSWTAAGRAGRFELLCLLRQWPCRARLAEGRAIARSIPMRSTPWQPVHRHRAGRTAGRR